MPDEPVSDLVETFSASLEEVVVAVGQGIAAAQAALDRQAVQLQEQIDADPVLSSYGVEATWYQLPKVDLQLKVAVSVTEPAQPAGASGSGPQPGVSAPGTGAPRPSLVGPRIVLQPVSAAYQNHFDYDASAASVVSLSIVPVPAPRAAAQSSVAPRLTADQAGSAALAASSALRTVPDATGKPAPAPDLRFDVRYNAAARTWYVVQFDPAAPAGAVVVAVDDVTGAARQVAP